MSDLPQIPGYVLKQKLGRGGMADVFLGLQENLEREVAIKVMAPHLFRDEQFSARFIKEAKTAAQLSHNGIVTIHDVGRAGDSYFIVMEYLQESLKERVKRVGKLGTRECLNIIRMIAEALGYAHKKGFIHRDLKPDNIMFRTDGSAVLVDFGIARAVDSTTQLTRTGMSIGTPQYMSPEQCMGEKIDGRTDIYSLGVVLYELLTGDVPYKAENTTGIIIKQIQEPVPKLPGNLSHYQHLIDSMMAKNKKNRIQDAEELIKFLDAHLTAGEIEPPPVATIPTATVLEEHPAPAPRPAAPAPTLAQQEPKRKWALPVILTVIVVGVVAAAVIFLPQKTVVDQGGKTPTRSGTTTSGQETGDKVTTTGAVTQLGEGQPVTDPGLITGETAGQETQSGEGQPVDITGQPVTGPDEAGVVKEPGTEAETEAGETGKGTEAETTPAGTEKKPDVETGTGVTSQPVLNPQYRLHLQRARNSYRIGDYDRALQHIAAARKVKDTPELAEYEKRVRQAKAQAQREKEPVRTTKPIRIAPTVKGVKTVTVLGLSPATMDDYNSKLKSIQIDVPGLYRRLAVKGQIVFNMNVDKRGRITPLSHEENLDITPHLANARARERRKLAIIGLIRNQLKSISLPPPKNKQGETVQVIKWRVTFKVGKFMNKIILTKQ